MSEQVQSSDKNLSRRRFFTTGKKIGVGLLSFIPATAILLRNTPRVQAHAVSPNYSTCSVVDCECAGYDCYNSQYHRWGPASNCYDSRTDKFCYTRCADFGC